MFSCFPRSKAPERSAGRRRLGILACQSGYFAALRRICTAAVVDQRPNNKHGIGARDVCAHVRRYISAVLLLLSLSTSAGEKHNNNNKQPSLSLWPGSVHLYVKKWLSFPSGGGRRAAGG